MAFSFQQKLANHVAEKDHYVRSKANNNRQVLAWRAGNSPRPCYHPCKSRKRGACVGDEKPALIWNCVSWYRPRKILKDSSRIYFNWFNRLNFKLILLTLLFKSLFLKSNLNCSYFLLLEIFSIVMQWGFCKYVLSKKIKADIFNKSGFRSRKLIVIVWSRNVRPVLQTWSLNTKNNLIHFRQQHCFYHYLVKECLLPPPSLPVS